MMQKLKDKYAGLSETTQHGLKSVGIGFIVIFFALFMFWLCAVFPIVAKLVGVLVVLVILAILAFCIGFLFLEARRDFKR